ncbi:MAG: hypothetical protein WBF48_11620 [Halarcobacter sp.]
MNSYCKYILEDFYEMFSTRKFEQKDVVNFIMIIRDYQKQNSILRELGDFIAHIKEKDRGESINLIKENSIFFTQYIDKDFYEDNPASLFFNLLETKKLARELNIIFKEQALEEDINKSEEPNCFIEQLTQSFKEFVFCIIMFLSSCKIKLLSKEFSIKVKYGGVIKAYIDFEDMNSFGIAIGTAVPILGLRNSRSNKYKEDDIGEFYAKRFSDGILAAVSYKKIFTDVTENDKYPCLQNN